MPSSLARHAPRPSKFICCGSYQPSLFHKHRRLQIPSFHALPITCSTKQFLSPRSLTPPSLRYLHITLACPARSLPSSTSAPQYNPRSRRLFSTSPFPRHAAPSSHSNVPPQSLSHQLPKCAYLHLLPSIWWTLCANYLRTLLKL